MVRHLVILATAMVTGQITQAQFGAAYMKFLQVAMAWEENLVSLPELQILRTREGPLAPSDARIHHTLLSIKLYYTTLQLFHRAPIYLIKPETRWDPFLPHYERIIALAHELGYSTRSPFAFHLSLEPGVVMPLFLVVTRCRHPVTRRHALTLLRRLNRQEGIWNSGVAAAVAEQVVLLEEKDLDVRLPLCLDDPKFPLPTIHVTRERPGEWMKGEGGWEAAVGWEGFPMVPESSRVLRIDVSVDVDAGKIDLAMYRDEAGDGNLTVETAVIRVY